MPADRRAGAGDNPPRTIAFDGSDVDGDSASTSDDRTPSDAFEALSNATRTAVIRTLDDDQPLAFSELHDATDEETSAGFAYHLRQLTDDFLRQRDDERYELTDAGRSVAREIRAGTFTESVDRADVELVEDCPFCGAAALFATVADNVTEISCRSCESPLLALSLPPGGYATREDGTLPDALDAHHRRRIGSFADGVCPECAGAVESSVEPADASVEPADSSDTGRDDSDEDGVADPSIDAQAPMQAAFVCETCGADLRCPVSLTLLDHPAVVAFYHDHDRDVRDRPIWNVGPEWHERVVSDDPRCVQVRTRLDDEDLLILVDGDGRVVGHHRVDADAWTDVGVETDVEDDSDDGFDDDFDDFDDDSDDGPDDGFGDGPGDGVAGPRAGARGKKQNRITSEGRSGDDPADDRSGADGATA